MGKLGEAEANLELFIFTAFRNRYLLLLFQGF